MLSFSDEKQKPKFEELYNLYKKHVYFIALKYLKDYQLAEDAVQMTYFKIFSNWEQFKEYDDFKTKGYIITIAKNTAIDILRKDKGNLSATIGEDDLLLDIVDDISLEKEILKKETVKLLNSKMEKLNDVERSILKLRYIDGKSDKEIADEICVPYDLIRSRAKRAKQKLAKSLLEEKEDIFDVFKS